MDMHADMDGWRHVQTAIGQLDEPLSGAAAATAQALRGVFFVQPLAVEAAGLFVECALADGRFEVRSGTLVADGGALAEVVVHCAGALVASKTFAGRLTDADTKCAKTNKTTHNIRYVKYFRK